MEEASETVHLGPDPLDGLLEAVRALPSWWRDKPPEDGFLGLRCRLQYTQDEIAGRSGLAQSLLSRLEGGADARLSTWRKAYAAMGFDLLLVPVSARTGRELEEAADAGRPPGAWIRQRARPRPHARPAPGGRVPVKRTGPPEDVPAGPSRVAAS